MAEAILTQPQFQDADSARVYLEAQVWPDGPVCPHCGSIAKHYTLTGKSNRPGLYKCKDCREPFTVTVGSIFERSKVPLHKWLLAVYLVCSSKKGISSHQIHRTLGVTYKTAWFMTHRIREAMRDEKGLLGSSGGTVEVDETFWGNKKKPGQKGRGYGHKMKVFSMVEPQGKKRSYRVAHVSAMELRPIMTAHIDPSAHIMTDELQTYASVHKEFAQHSVLCHGAGEYARVTAETLITTNTVESSFAILKRGLYGTFHHVGEQHLQRYATEFDFRWNNRIALGIGISIWAFCRAIVGPAVLP